MNLVVLNGRLVRDPELKFGQSGKAYSRFSIAVDRPFQTSTDSQTADFINCVAFSKAAEFAERYFRQGMRVLVSGRLQTGNYTNKDGHKVYTTDVILDSQEFADSKGENTKEMSNHNGSSIDADGFMNIPDGVDDEGLPFN